MKKIIVPLLCAAFGCAGAISIPDSRPSAIKVDGVRYKKGTFKGALDYNLFEQMWRPENSEPRATLVIVHGLKDHSARYQEFANRLAQHGYEVRAFDLRGHGTSEGRRVYIDHFEDYLKDLELFIAHVRPLGRPLFVLGHSMGGAIVTEWLLTRKPAVDGVILSAAALTTDVPAITRGATRTLGFLLPLTAVLSLDLDHFSRDKAVVAACKADPLVDQGNGPARTAGLLLKAISHIGDHMEEVEAPIFVMHGSADVITQPEGSRELVRRARSADKTLKIYDGLWHDLLHEPEKEQVMSDVTAWMDAHLK